MTNESINEGWYIGYKTNLWSPYFGAYKITSNVISIHANPYIRLVNETLTINKVEQLNGKTIPPYPASTGSFTLKCVNGTLTWVADE